MLFFIGIAVVFVTVIGGFAVLAGGDATKLIVPAEYVIVAGALMGAFIIANPMSVIIRVPTGFFEMLRGAKHNKDSYMELLSLLYQTFRLAKAKGMLALEGHVEHPNDSNLFSQFPGFREDQHALMFLCDYLRLLTLGTDNPHEIEALMDEEIESHHNERIQLSNAVQVAADAAPAIGIVAAVLGVIKTMSSIGEPPEVLGGLIASALVGTFLGVFIGYAVLGPMAAALRLVYDSETRYYLCMKSGILAYMQGNAPAVCVEFARKSLMPSVRPNFYEVEEATQSLPPV